MCTTLLSFEKIGFPLRRKRSKNQETRIPKEGKWFRVDPKTIKRQLFEEERVNAYEEHTRELIVRAFQEVDANPMKYARAFKTMFPARKWELCKPKTLRAMAKMKGGHLANWVEQALEWAQRISNGETWAAICIDPDAARNFRIVEWERGFVRLIGGSTDAEDFSAPTEYEGVECDKREKVKYATPLIVVYYD